MMQAYSKLFYESKLKDVVMERWKEEYLSLNPKHDSRNPIPHPELKFRNQVTLDLFEEEPDDVKAQVEAERERSGQEESTDEDLEPEEQRRIKTAKQYQR